jgi:diguanylate cyclase (GGDEF)-like protein
MKKILIADDDPATLHYLGEMLKGEYQVFVAANGLQAVELARRILPDLVLLDITMPGLDGYEACLEMKKDAALAPVPVIFITARSGESDIVRGFDAGGQDYIAKPFHPKELYARVRTHLELKNAQEHLKNNAVRLEDMNRELAAALERMEIMARVDPLTGLSNRRYLLERLEQEAARTRRHGKCLSLAIADIDDFKAVNDLRGHECGDLVLQRTSSVIMRGVRREDLVARWGGEEFLLVFPEIPPESAVAIAEKLRALVESERIDYGGEGVSVTITLGVTGYDPAHGIDANIRRADNALYRGKRGTKNCVCLEE